MMLHWTTLTTVGGGTDCKFETDYPFLGYNEDKVYVKWDPEFDNFVNTPSTAFDISYQDISGDPMHVTTVTSSSFTHDTNDGENRLIVTFPAQTPAIFSGGNHELSYTKIVGYGGISINGRWLRTFPFSADTHIVKEEEPLITNANFFTIIDEYLSTGTTVDFGDIVGWNVSLVTNMAEAFSGDRAGIPAAYETFNKDLSSWNVGAVTTMSKMFSGKSTSPRIQTEFNNGQLTDLGTAPLTWNVSNCANFGEMFRGAAKFNQELQAVGGTDTWDFLGGGSTALSNMFAGFGNTGYPNYTTLPSTIFNNGNNVNPINEWDMEGIEYIISMFQNNSAFNREIGDWNTTNLLGTYYTFKNATAFNQDLLTDGVKWDMSSVISMQGMFNDATSFNKDLSSWDLTSVTSGANMVSCFEDSGLSSQTWDSGSSAGGTANSWYTKATGLNPSSFYTDGADGNSPTGSSQPELTTSSASVPGNISDLTVAAWNASAKIEIEWSAPDDGGSTITKYQVMVGKEGTFDGTWQEMGGVPSPLKYLVQEEGDMTSLVNGTNYSLKVRAENAIGFSDPGSNIVNETPTSVAITVESDPSIYVINWPLANRKVGVEFKMNIMGHPITSPDDTPSSMPWNGDISENMINQFSLSKNRKCIVALY